MLGLQNMSLRFRITLFITLASLSGASSAYQLIDLGTLGGNQSWAWAVNDAQTVAGGSRNSYDSLRAFSYQGAGLSDRARWWPNSEAWAINNGGVVVGWATDSSGNSARSGPSARPWMISVTWAGPTASLTASTTREKSSAGPTPPAAQCTPFFTAAAA